MVFWPRGSALLSVGVVSQPMVFWPCGAQPRVPWGWVVQSSLVGLVMSPVVLAALSSEAFLEMLLLWVPSEDWGCLQIAQPFIPFWDRHPAGSCRQQPALASWMPVPWKWLKITFNRTGIGWLDAGPLKMTEIHNLTEPALAGWMPVLLKMTENHNLLQPATAGWLPAVTGNQLQVAGGQKGIKPNVVFWTPSVGTQTSNDQHLLRSATQHTKG